MHHPKTDRTGYKWKEEDVEGACYNSSDIQSRDNQHCKILENIRKNNF
jgi:hypothetical protein